MEDNKKKVLLIVNPCAGKTKSRAGTFDIVNKFSNNDYKFSVHTTKCSGDATNIVKRELGDHDMVVCCGGDGTLNETINGVMDMPRRVPIGYIPAGTTNDLASTLGIPRGIKEATDLIIRQNTNSYDIGLFNNRYFSYVASFGAFTTCSYATPQKLKNIFGHSAYVAKAFTEVKDIHPIKMRIEYDGGVLEDSFVFGAISNSTSVAGCFKLNDVTLNDGIFEVLLVRNISFAGIIPAIINVCRQHYDGKKILLFKTSKLKITALEEDVSWTLDGENGGKHRNVMIHVLEKAIDICSTDNDLFIKEEPVAIENVEPAAKKPKGKKIVDTAEEAVENLSLADE